MAKTRIFHPLRSPAVALLWGGLCLSAIGDQLYAVAVAWISVAVLGSNAGYLSALQAFIVLLAVLGVGGWADQWDHRRSMMGSDIARALVLALVATLWIEVGHPNLIQLILAVVVLALGEAVFDPALHTMLPSLVEDIRLLPAANGLFDATERSARLVGPGLVALLAGLIPVVHFLTLDALSFLVSAGAIALIGRHRRRDPPPHFGKVREKLWPSIMRGVGAMRGHPLLGYTLTTTGVLNGAWYTVFFLGLPLMIQARGLAGPGGSSLGAYGLVISAYGCTNLLATIVCGSRAPSPRPQRQMFVGNLIVGSGIGLLALSTLLPTATILPGFMAAAALGALGGPMKDIPLAVLRQACLRRDDLAAALRVSMAANSAGALSALMITPLVFRHTGVAPVVLVCGACIILIGVVGLARYSTWVEDYRRAGAP